MSIIVPYDPSWPEEFERVKQQIAPILGASMLYAEHIGSTAIPGMPAKPIVDMMVAVDAIDRIADWVAPLSELGFLYRQEEETFLVNRRFFSRETPEACHVFLYFAEFMSPFWQEWWLSHVRFRNYLLRFPQKAQAYADLKRVALATFTQQGHPLDAAAYQKTKGPFLEYLYKDAKQYPELAEPYYSLVQGHLKGQADLVEQAALPLNKAGPDGRA